MHAQPSKFLNDNEMLEMFKCNVSEILNAEMDENYQMGAVFAIKRAHRVRWMGDWVHW